MTLNEFEKIVEICYTKKIVVETRRKKQVTVEQELTADEIAFLIANEFGFDLNDEEEIND